MVGADRLIKTEGKLYYQRENESITVVQQYTLLLLKGFNLAFCDVFFTKNGTHESPSVIYLMAN